LRLKSAHACECCVRGARATRYHVLQQRIASGEVNVYKIDDPNMPADFLTKWLDAGKLNISIEYATNQRAAVAARHGSSETI
jgi:hypothetical protein